MEIIPVAIVFLVLFLALNAALIYLPLWIFYRRKITKSGLSEMIIPMAIIVFVVNAVVCDVL